MGMSKHEVVWRGGAAFWWEFGNRVAALRQVMGWQD